MGLYIELAKTVLAKFPKQSIPTDKNLQTEEICKSSSDNLTEHPLIKYALKLFEGKIERIENVTRNDGTQAS